VNTAKKEERHGKFATWMAGSRAEGNRPRPLGVGLLVPQWEGHLGGETPRWRDTLAVAQAAEAVGFDTVWIIDDLLIDIAGERFGVWECWSWTAALAAATQHIALGTFVCANTHRNPALLAKIAETVDEISNGRLTLGMGSGGGDTQHRAFGFAWDSRFDRFEEGIRIVHELLHCGSSSLHGTWYQTEACELHPRGPRPAGLPLLVGTVGAGPRMLRATAQYADEWTILLPWTGPSDAARIPALRAAADAACRQIGRDPASLRRSAGIGVSLAGSPVRFGTWDQTTNAISGAPEQIAEALRGFAAEGIDQVQVMLGPTTVAGVEAFAPVLELLDRR
jgi:alkanesulfonate monooxygenase SsuD/methylene tetrahydromethanopterin reductase-like flavin-dependent oxidoreductase (luciferase family)